MKAIDWQAFLYKQREQYGKVVFTTTELANVSGTKWPSLKVALQRLVARCVIERYTDGRYGLPGAAKIEDLVVSLDSSAYITGMYALYRHQVITQMPVEIVCFTCRRHNQSRVRQTSMGRIVFVCVTNSIYSYPPTHSIAPPEQALFDFVYVCRRRGVSVADLVTFRNLDRMGKEQLELCLPRYPKSVGKEVERLLLS